MKIKEILLVLLVFILISVFFFNKTVVRGFVPLPGDLLVSEYNPWKSYSFLGYNPGSFPNKAQYFDVIRQLYPWKTFSINLIKNGEIPLWNPYNFSGSPLLANFQSAVFYPLNLFYLIFPQIPTWTFYIFIQTVLAGLFTYLYTRKIGIGTIGSFFASICFSFSLFMSVFLEYGIIGHTILWLPLILYLLENIIKKPSFVSLILFVLSLVLSFLGGHIQIFGFIFTFVLIYSGFRVSIQKWPRNKKIVFLSSFIFLLLISLGISSIQLLPTLELINNSARSSQSYQFLIEKLLIQPNQLILLMSPDFYGNPVTRNYQLSDSYPGNALYVGLVGLIFAVFALPAYKKNNFIKFFTIISAVLLTLFVRNPITEIFYSFKIPFFSTGSPNNAIFLLSFSLSILSGFGLEYWIKKNNKIFTFIVAFLAMGFFIIFLSISFFHLQVSIKNFYYSSLIFLILLILFAIGTLLRRKREIAVLLIVVAVFDLFYFFQKFNPFIPPQFVFPKTKIFDYLNKNVGVNRFWGYGSAGIEANVTTYYSLFSPDGYDPLYPKAYGEFIQSSDNGKINMEFTNKTRSDAVITPGYGEEDLSSNFYRLRVMDVLGVKYILDKKENGSTEKTFPIDRFKLIYKNDGWQIFENLKAAPRIFLTSDYKVYSNKDEFEKIFFSKKFDPSKTILLEKSVNFFSNLNGSEEQKEFIKLISYSPNKIIINTQTSRDKFLFLSDTYYPGWKAFIDGSETEIYKADYTFRSIIVSRGKHIVEFNYNPNSFKFGFYASILWIFVALIASFILPKIIKNEK